MCYHKYKADVWKLNYYSKLISSLNNYTNGKEIRQESNKMFIQFFFLLLFHFVKTCCNLLMVV